MRKILVVRDLVVGFDHEPLLEDLSFTVNRGEVFAILGGSGCGKTTVLRHLVGLEQPLAGSVHIAGRGAPAEALQPPAFGVLFQSGALFGSLTLLQNVALPLQQWTTLPADAVLAVAQARLELVGLGAFADHMPAAVSGGMKKRAGIARALALDSPLLFLDEPSAGLDPVTAAELDELIMTLSSSLGVTVVMVSHELASISKVVDTCIMLDRDAGGIIARGDPRELADKATDPRVHAFFHRQARPR
ncbi:MAG TPA: ATP-binding cassette domain-containing protein [Planctomycetota bacterium]|nr:ATP-binding cassette domain-containing protein [Planctomycetota bacterium]